MLESGLPEDVGDDEDIARFLTQKSHFNQIEIKGSAYFPNQQGKTSVYRNTRDAIEQLEEIGKKLAQSRNISVYGIAFCKARWIRVNGLQINPNEPPLRHADIVGWPVEEDPQLMKARKKQLGIRIAQKADSPFFFKSPIGK